MVAHAHNEKFLRSIDRGGSWLKCSLAKKLVTAYHKEQVHSVVHACSFNYARGRDRNIAVQRQPQVKV
jgi:hypothetical protein